MKFKKLIAAGLTAAMFMTAGVAVSAAGSAKVTRDTSVTYSQSGTFDIDTINDKVTLFRYYGDGGDVVIPNDVEEISGYVFADCTGITSVTIPDSVTDIGFYAFSGCTNMKSVRLSKKLKVISSSTFRDCKMLTGISIPASVQEIGTYAFANCKNLTTVTIPNSVKTIEDHAFDGCSELATISIPESVTSIGADTFKGCESLMDIYYTGTKDKWDKLAKDLKLNSYTTVHCATELKILTQPSNVTAKPGDSVSFTVKAQGDGLKYQWYYMKAGAASWSQWGSRTTATTTATANESWDGMRVYCKVTDKYGKTVKSNPATVTVTQELKITKQPVGATLKAGENLKLSLKAEGIGLSYQWYYKKTGQTSWNIWNGHTSFAESVTVPASWDGIQLYCKVTDKTGKSVNSNTVKIILSDVLAITQQPTNKTVPFGNSVTLSLKAKGENLTYQWYYKKATATAWSTWNGRTHASETVTPNESWNGMQLYCKVSDKSGKTIDSAKIKIILSGVITVTQQPTNKSVLFGNPVTLSLKAEGNDLSYQWYYKKTGQSSFSAWSGRTHASETVTPNATWNGIQLYCLVKDAFGKSVKSNTVKITVTGAELKITRQPEDQYIELGDSVTVSLEAQGTGLTYQWYYRKYHQENSAKWSGRTHASETVTPNESWDNIELYCIVKDANGNSVKSDSIFIYITEDSPLITPGMYNCYWSEIEGTEYDSDMWSAMNSLGTYFVLYIYSDNTAILEMYTEDTLQHSYDMWFDEDQFVSDDIIFDYNYDENCVDLFTWYDGQIFELAFELVEEYE